MTVVCWNLFFVALNVFLIMRIVASRNRTDGQDAAQSVDGPAEAAA